MIDETKSETGDRKMFLVKVCAFVVALAALGGVIYFFAFVSYSTH